MFDGIVDGFSIVSTEVASYANFNYLYTNIYILSGQ